jgi:hypothetical protein
LFSGPELNDALFSGSAHIFIYFSNICKDGVEDETHFLVKCKNFENIRKPYLETIYTLFPNLKTCNNENIFIWIMGCENPEALRTLIDSF